MNGSNGAADCTAYIDKLAFFGSNYSPGKLIISASAGGFGNTNWYFDYYGGTDPFSNYADEAAAAVTNAIPDANVIGSSGLGAYAIPNFTRSATNVAGYFTGGWDGGTGDPSLFIDGTVRFFGNSGWYIMSTVDSFNGQRVTFQAGFLTWFAQGAFQGTSYSNTPAGGVIHLDEPYAAVEDHGVYFGGWAAGRLFALSAWDSILGKKECGVVGDPFITK